MSPERNGAPGPPQQMLELVKEKMNMCKAFCMPLQGPVLECDEYRDGSEEMPGDYNWYAKKKKETEKYKDALQSIKHHIEGQESALAVAIKATCDGALLAEDGKEINTTDGKKK